jgi:hypothetical protein
MRMSVNTFLLLCSLLGFCSCGHKPYPQSLITADNLIYTHPDSAIALLKSIESTIQGESENVQMYYQSLCIKANDKAHTFHPSDSLALPSLHYYIQKENTLLRTKNRNKTIGIVTISGCFIIVMIAFIAYRQYSKRKNRKLKQQLKELQSIEQENQEKIEFLERYKFSKEELERRLLNTKPSEDKMERKQSVQKTELLNHILQQQAIENEQEKEAQETLYRSDLYKQLQERTNSARGKAYVAPEEWESLKEFINPAYPTFFERLHSLHAPNDNELHVCVLLKLRFRPADIARLLQLKPESISSIRKRLYQKVTGSKGKPEMWDKIIYSL